MYNENEETIINNEYSSSDILPTVESITYLIQYCDSVFKQFINLIEDDKKRNNQFKPEYKNYSYKKSYGEYFEIYIREKNYNTITCKNFETFKEFADAGNLKNISNLEIKLHLDYKRGQGYNLTEYENSFSILFKPYETTFIRKSNHNEPNINQIEENLKNILENFPVANSIFSTK